MPIYPKSGLDMEDKAIRLPLFEQEGGTLILPEGEYILSKQDAVTITLEIEYMGNTHVITNGIDIKKYRQSAIDHDYSQIETHVRKMLARLLHEAQPIHPRHPELEEVGRKLIQGGK